MGNRYPVLGKTRHLCRWASRKVECNLTISLVPFVPVRSGLEDAQRRIIRFFHWYRRSALCLFFGGVLLRKFICFCSQCIFVLFPVFCSPLLWSARVIVGVSHRCCCCRCSRCCCGPSRLHAAVHCWRNPCVTCAIFANDAITLRFSFRKNPPKQSVHCA